MCLGCNCKCLLSGLISSQGFYSAFLLTASWTQSNFICFGCRIADISHFSHFTLYFCINLTRKRSQRRQFLNKRRVHQMNSRMQITSKPIGIKINRTIRVPIGFQGSPNPLLQYLHLVLLVA